MVAALLAKYRPPAKVSNLQSDIITFTKPEDEFIHDSWERSKVNKASNHKLPPWLEIQFFYNGLKSNTKIIIDAAAGEALIK